LLAAYFYWLNNKRNGGPVLNIAALGYRKDEFLSSNAKFITGATDNATSGAHFAWTYDCSRFDDCETAGGEIDALEWYDDYLIIPEHLTDKFSVSALNHGTWNVCFNRRLYLPEMEEFFDIKLSEVRR
jgi:hypothetical protein